MLKQLLTSGSVLVLLLAGSLSTQAGTSGLGLSSESQTLQSQTTPESQANPTQGAPQGQTVSSQELQQFVSVIPKLQEIDQATQQKAAQAITQAGLSTERFQEIYKSQQSPDVKPSSPASPQEQTSFSQASSQIQSIAQQAQAQQEQAIRAGGLEPERFSQILAAIQRDPSLQQQLRQMIQSK